MAGSGVEEFWNPSEEFWDISFVPGPEVDKYYTEERFLESDRRYVEECNSSGGFDVESDHGKLQGKYRCGGIVKCKHVSPELLKLSRFAVNAYNQEENSGSRVCKVCEGKYGSNSGSYVLHNIGARDASGETKTYRAKVWRDIRPKNRLLLFQPADHPITM